MENRIKDVIKEKGYTMTGFAEVLGMTRENLSRIIKEPSSPTLEKLSNALNVPVWQFFASPDEVKSIVCPHCGKEIHIKVE
jgi:transcriptional regulator with XRE-family HTH domain